MAHVEVNEVRVFATTQGADWWVLFRQAHQSTGRIQTITASITGDLCSVACDTAADAESLAAYMVDQGLPESSIKVRAA